MLILAGLGLQTAESGATEKEVRVYRILSLVGAVVISAMGVVHRITDPLRVDPTWERVAVVLVCLTAGGLTYVYRREQVHYLAYAVYGVVSLWILHLTVLNALAPEYALGFFLVVSAISPLFRTQRDLLFYILCVLTLLGATVFEIPDPKINPVVFASDVVVVCVLSYLVLDGRLRTQADLAASEERYALAALGSNDGLWDWDLQARRVYFSPRWKEMLGYGEGEVGDGPEEWLGRVHPEDRTRVEAQIRTHQEEHSSHFEIEYRMLHRDGTHRWMLARGVALGNEAGESYRMAGSQTDVTARKRTEEQLVYQALHDALTGLPNRALLMDRLGLALRRGHRRSATRVVVFFLDLDHFKVVNDGLGHTAGDELLVGVARRLVASVREQDTVARLGGDEFVVLLEEVHGAGEATLVVERVLEGLLHPFEVAGQEVFTSASIGITLSGAHARPEDLLRDADTAMYRAKAGGRGRYEIFDPEMQAQAAARLRMEGELRRALEREEFRVAYQPIVSLETGVPIGFEALVRWEHPERGRILPGEFISLAEETGLIVPLGSWVLREACRQLRAWQTELPGWSGLLMSVNLSPRQFARADLVRQVDEVLRELSLPPGTLQLELTESLLMEDAEAAVAVLAALESRGVRLAIDDFGTGYSSLSYLQRFPISTLKIDRSFVAGMEAGSSQSKLVRTMVGLARSLGMGVVAEGVETEEQLRVLKRLGCERGQGFLFSHALSSDEVVPLLARERAAEVVE
jgi:diguanylate cyclase (GGDEF)-like protein/PAS domain S-box-containing protein